MITATLRRLGAAFAVAAFLIGSLPATAEVQVASWGYKPDPAGNAYLATPVGLAVDGQGTLFVADMGNNRVLKFTIQEQAGGPAPVLGPAIGTLGSAAGQFNLPFGLTVDRKGNLLVVDTANSRVQKLSRAGAPILSWGGAGSLPGRFNLPREIAVDSENRYYVTDEFNHRVQVFNEYGVYLRSFGGYGEAAGKFRLPQGIAIDGQDRVFVADTFNHRVQVLSATGQPLASLGASCGAPSQEAMCFPRGVGIDPQGNVYIADTFNHRIKKYSAGLQFQYNHGNIFSLLYPNTVRPVANDVFYVSDTGNNRIVRYHRQDSGSPHQTVLGVPRNANGQFNGPGGMVVGIDQRVYVADSYNHRIQVFDANGNFLAKWGANGGAGGPTGYGFAPGQFWVPQQLAVDAEGRIYVADSLNARIQIFDADGHFIAQMKPMGPLGLPLFTLPTGVAVARSGKIYVADLLGSRIHEFADRSTYVKSWGVRGTGLGQFREPAQLTVDTDGYVYVADTRNSRVQKFTADGQFVLAWGTNPSAPNPDVILTRGTGNGQLFFPAGIRAAGDYVYVADSFNNRMQKFDRDGQFVEAWGGFGGATTSFFSPAAVAVGPWGQTYVADQLLHGVRKTAASDGGYTTGPTWPW